MSGLNTPDHDAWERWRKVRRKHVERLEMKAHRKVLISKAQITKRRN